MTVLIRDYYVSISEFATFPCNCTRAGIQYVNEPIIYACIIHQLFFSPELLFNVSHAISYEVRAHWNGNAKQGKYISGQGLSCFSPVINIMRHPLWGRNQVILTCNIIILIALVFSKNVGGLWGSYQFKHLEQFCQIIFRLRTMLSHYALHNVIMNTMCASKMQ